MKEKKTNKVLLDLVLVESEVLLRVETVVVAFRVDVSSSKVDPSRGEGEKKRTGNPTA